MDSTVSTGISGAFTSVQTQIIAFVTLALPYIIAITILVAGVALALALVNKVRGMVGSGKKTT